jgi:pilus assembly protein CpaB
MNRNTRLVTVLAIALAAASLASFAVYRALSANAAGAAVPQTIDTLVAAQPIPAGTMITRDHVKVVSWPAHSRLSDSLSNASDVVDRGAIVSIALNEPITPAKLAAAGAGAGLPPTIPPGMRAMSVRVNEVVGVAGFVVPGTRVDVLVTFDAGTRSETMARVVVSNAQVLTAGTRFDQEKARKDGTPIPTSVVTLLVTPEDAERIALASAEGRITLTLRNPLDTTSTESAGIRAGGLMGLPPPAPPAAPRPAPKPAPVAAAPVAPPPPPPQPYTVEAIRGAKRTTEPVQNEEPEKPRDVPPSEEKPQQ